LAEEGRLKRNNHRVFRVSSQSKKTTRKTRRTSPTKSSARKATRRKATSNTARHRTGRANAAPVETAHVKTARRKGGRYWSARVTHDSDALDLQRGVFSLNDPKRIAASLKRSAERSHRRKSTPYRSALSMLVFFINRAGRKLPAARRRKLEQAKVELRKQFGRD
jgi:hypothetical protein